MAQVSGNEHLAIRGQTLLVVVIVPAHKHGAELALADPGPLELAQPFVNGFSLELLGIEGTAEPFLPALVFGMLSVLKRVEYEQLTATHPGRARRAAVGMRDVDMFVGVASVGNDPTWNDGGPEGRYRDYWHNYSFGDLNASAKTRKEVLQRLIPRQKISTVCTFEEEFLVVRGQLRTHKTHLDSGNILMEPNDQYLCIVPKQGEQSEDGLLPFEGDPTLSVILSKAFLLAADTKIKDETISRQIEQK